MLSRFLRRRVFNAKGAKCTMDFENGARNSYLFCVNVGADVAFNVSFLLHSTRF